MMLTKRIDGLRQFLACCLMFVCAALTGVSAFAQDRNVSGVVLDETDQGVPGAYVVVKGETRGAMTDDQGRFNISVSPTDVLVASFLGYIDEEITVGDQTKLTIKLVPAANELEEVVKVAYGTQRKASVIGSISTVDMGTLAQPTGNLSTGLAGKLAGVVAMQRTGEPGASAEFWIRGVNTFGENSTPLILVDGVERSMDLVDVEDIQSFSILKDATATALYGVRGANGIVLITTRRGEESKPRVNIKVETGFTSPVKVPEMANTQEFMDYVNGVYVDNGDQPVIDAYDYEQYMLSFKNAANANHDLYPSVNWQDVIFKDQAMTTKANINITGGTKRVRYYVGGSYYFEDGIFNAVKKDGYSTQMNFNRFNFRANVDINVTQSTVVGMNISTQFTHKNTPGGTLSDLYSYALLTPPVALPAIFSDGTLSNVSGATNTYNLLNESGYRELNENNAQTTLSIQQDFSDFVTEGLTARAAVSWDATNGTTLNRWISPKTFFLDKKNPYNEDGSYNYQAKDNGSGYIQLNSAPTHGYNTLNFEAAINYERQFAYAHRVSAMFLYNMRTRTNTSPGGYYAAFPYKNMGIAGRATYSYKDRYFAEFNFGYNGSENFAPGHRFGFFPSGAIGYLISNEPWFEGAKRVITNLKLKASYGKIGNDQIGGGRRFAYNSTMDTAAPGFNWGMDSPSNGGGISTGEVGTATVAWEEATKSNVGIELDLFNQLKIQADYFYDYREGIFVKRQSTPSIVGLITQQYVNIGEMMNSGFDMTAQYDYTFANGFSVSARGNFTFNRNKIIYNDKPDQVWPYRNEAGFALNQQRGLIAEGLFSSQEEIDNWPRQTFGKVRVGDIKYRDINGDGEVNEDDYVAIGYTTVPEINYGFGVSLNWKGVDMSVFFSGVSHVTRIIGGTSFWGGAGNFVLQTGNVYKDVALNHWTAENPDPNAVYPRPSFNVAENNNKPSTYWQRDMSFLRLKNVELGYTFPKKWTKKAGMSSLRIYAAGVNLLTFSKFKLWDPELNGNGGQVYPMTKNITIGLNVNF